ncbi:hypothetical protein ESZ50_09925 [Weissella muntiaci]|uniref:Uncharacterized protein n=1 Tax=Weissella muntiaci TaxID=2508881 RepID=A0A6C2C2R7_9LACO|nr:hypothetical protein [Weissella muntiaci]TYC48082.1 hypothetical protein ESZ50_09925 [Weissella muntiaci]
MRHKVTYLFLAILVVILVAGTIKSFGSGNGELRVPTLTQAQKNKTTNKALVKKEATGASYSPSKTDLSDPNYASSGVLNNVGQFTIDSNGLETKLVAKTSSSKLITNGKIIYRILNISIFENTARTNESLQTARVSYNEPDLGKHYKTMAIDYMIANSSDVNVTTEGISTIKINSGGVISSLNGLQNDTSLSSTGVFEGLTITTGASAIVPNSTPNSGYLTLQFASVKHANTIEDLVQPAKPIRIKY